MLNGAIVGLGRWGLRLAESVQGSDQIRFVRGVTRNPADRQDFARRTGIALTASYAEALRDPGIDAVVLATPHSQHHLEIVEAARAGKHVFVEKPFTLTRASAEAAVEACRAAKVTLGVGFNRRHAPAFVELKRRIAAGEIGELLHIEGQASGGSGLQLKAGNWRAMRAESPGGAMTSRGVHALDAMIQIAGPVASVQAISERRALAVEIDDTTSMLLRFAGGVTGYLGTLHTTGEFWRVHAFGTKGWLEMRGDTELLARGMGAESSPERIAFAPLDRERAELEAFAAAVAAGQKFTVPPTEIVNGVAVLEALMASAAGGGAVRVA